MKTLKLDLSDAEKRSLKKGGFRIGQLSACTADELCVILQTTEQRAKAVLALIEFQGIPSIGPKFAGDLIDMGFFSINQLKGTNAAALFNAHEKLIGKKTDPCVEDQFRLVVHYANNPGSNKRWWHFTAERKLWRVDS